MELNLEENTKQEDQLEQIGRRILALSRNELYLQMRFLDVALSSLAYVQDFSVSLVATDGWNLYFHPGELGGLYRKNRLDVNRAYFLNVIFFPVFQLYHTLQPPLFAFALVMAFTTTVSSVSSPILTGIIMSRIP